jgi:hypothetical protein
MDNFELTMVLILCAVAIGLGYLFGWLNGTIGAYNQIEETKKLKELCTHETFFYSDSNYKRCEDVDVKPTSP